MKYIILAGLIISAIGHLYRMIDAVVESTKEQK